MRRVALVLLAVLAVLAACGSGGGAKSIGRDGAPVVDGADDVVIGEPLDAYRVRYRVEEQNGDEVDTTEATLLVERPYRSRFETTGLTRVSDFAYLGVREKGHETQVQTAVPAPAPGDIRVDVLHLDAGREVRRVAGRECQVHRFGAPL